MTKKIPTKDEALQPFKEKTELIGGFIEEIREKLGEEDATKINDTLVGLQTTVTETEGLIETTVEEQIKLAERNGELVEVNNELYIKNRDNLKGNQGGGGNNNQNIDDDEDDDPLATYGELATTKDK